STPNSLGQLDDESELAALVVHREQIAVCGASKAALWRETKPLERNVPGRGQPQSSARSSTTRASLRRWSSTESKLPSAALAKPHGGESQSRVRGRARAAFNPKFARPARRRERACGAGRPPRANCRLRR